MKSLSIRQGFEVSKDFLAVILFIMIMLIMPNLFSSKAYCQLKNYSNPDPTSKELSLGYGLIPYASPDIWDQTSDLNESSQPQDLLQSKHQKGLTPSQSYSPATNDDLAQLSLTYLKDLCIYTRENEEKGSLAVVYRAEGSETFDVIHTHKKDTLAGMTSLALLNISTDQTDPFQATYYWNKSVIKDAFFIIVTENDPKCPERIFDAELHIRDAENRAIQIKFNYDPANQVPAPLPNAGGVISPVLPTISISFVEPEDGFPDLTEYEAWLYFNTHIGITSQILKQHSDHILKHLDDKPSLEEDLEEGLKFLQDLSPDQELMDEEPGDTKEPEFFPTPGKPTLITFGWLRHVAESSHTPITHSNAYIESARKNQASTSTNLSIWLIASFFIFLAIWIFIDQVFGKKISRFLSRMKIARSLHGS